MDRVTYLEKTIEILWSYIPESDFEINEKIYEEIEALEYEEIQALEEK